MADRVIDRSAGAASSAPVEPGLVARVAAGLRYAVTGRAPDWFGPGQPVAPAVPPEAREQVAGRAFDFAAGVNLAGRARAGEAVTFEQLRALADAHDLVRLAIETRKDQMEKLAWTVQRVDRATTTGAGVDADPRAAALAAALRRPDGEHTFRRWLRMLLEDLLVLDAPSVYVRPTRGGGVYALEVVDGATIKRVLDDRGRTPAPPSPAYQQVLKGLPAVDYTRDELLYRPRNVRAHKAYGYSPVEQVTFLVNVALRRQVHVLNYYTEGNVPEMLLGVPATWTTPQIETFQAYWDLLLAGDLAARRRVKFVPGDLKAVPTKQADLTDAFDEWIARVVCYAFSLPPTAFVQQVNRATAGTAQEVAMEEGLAPIMTWTKDLMDEVIQGPLGAPDYEFAWQDTTDVDPMVQASIDQIYVTAGVDTPDEVRERRGKAPLTPAQRAELDARRALAAPGIFGGASGAASIGSAAPPTPGGVPQDGGDEDSVRAGAAEKAAGRSLWRRPGSWDRARVDEATDAAAEG